MTKPSTTPDEPLIPVDDPPLVTKEGWEVFVKKPNPKPPMPCEEEVWKKLTPAERDEVWRALGRMERRRYDEARIDYISGLPTILLPQLATAHSQLLSITTANARRPPGARDAAVIDGDPQLGKSTMATSFGRDYERKLRAKHGWGRTVKGELYLPVVYVTMADDSTVKSINESIADFYGIPLRNKTKDDLTREIRSYAHRCGTSLILIDDIHFLDIGTKTGKLVNKHIKTLMNVIAATFVIIGVGVKQSKILTEGKSREAARLAQTQWRYSPIDVNPFATADDNDLRALLRTLEDMLPLHGAYQGMLCQRLAKYLYERSDGVLGDLMELVRRGAITAIEKTSKAIEKDGPLPELNERLAKALLDDIHVSHAAETRYSRTHPRKKTATKPEAPGQSTAAAPQKDGAAA